MEKREFKAESKRLLELMINSIYTHKEIFLRELISNASDAMDKIYYKALTDDTLTFDKNDYFIKISVDKDNRLIKISDTGIGMNREELEENLGVIAKSDSRIFKEETEIKDGHEIIGKFGVGFYSAFMVADKVTVISRGLGREDAHKWESEGIDGYFIEEAERDSVGTDVILKIKENTEDESYDNFLEDYRLRTIVKKYSDFIRYPIKMDITEKRPKADNEKEFEDVTEEKVINSMVPIWKKNKNELTKEDYEKFYEEKHFGFDQPLTHIHISVDGAISYNAVLFVPERPPYDFYTRDYEKGLELYSSGVLIMSKCADLLPDYFSFVKGIVDSEDLSLNISREILQHDRQLKLIAKNVKTKIKNELENILKNDREKYEKFFESFGRQIKYGVYENFGSNKEELQDLLLFYSSKEKKLITLAEYKEAMPEEQKYIYYASGESVERLEKLPQTEMVSEKGYDILYFTDDVDEFAIKMLRDYQEKEFKNVSAGDLGLDSSKDEEKKDKGVEQDEKRIFTAMKDILADRVKEVKASPRLKNHPVCLSNAGDLSIEMEKVLKMMPDGKDLKADKILEINTEHEVFHSLKVAEETDKDKFRLYTELLYNQALLIEGLEINDPLEFTNNICKLMK